MARGQNDDDLKSSATYMGVAEKKPNKQFEFGVQDVDNTKYIDD